MKGIKILIAKDSKKVIRLKKFKWSNSDLQKNYKTKITKKWNLMLLNNLLYLNNFI